MAELSNYLTTLTVFYAICLVLVCIGFSARYEWIKFVEVDYSDFNGRFGLNDFKMHTGNNPATKIDNYDCDTFADACHQSVLDAARGSASTGIAFAVINFILSVAVIYLNKTDSPHISKASAFLIITTLVFIIVSFVAPVLMMVVVVDILSDFGGSYTISTIYGGSLYFVSGAIGILLLISQFASRGWCKCCPCEVCKSESSALLGSQQNSSV